MGKVLAILLLGALATHAAPAMSAMSVDAEAPIVTLVTGQRSANGLKPVMPGPRTAAWSRRWDGRAR